MDLENDHFVGVEKLAGVLNSEDSIYRRNRNNVIIIMSLHLIIRWKNR